MGLCNILELRSLLGDWSLNLSAACLYALCHSRLVEAREFSAGGGNPFWEVDFNTAHGTGELLYV